MNISSKYWQIKIVRDENNKSNIPTVRSCIHFSLGRPGIVCFLVTGIKVFNIFFDIRSVRPMISPLPLIIRTLMHSSAVSFSALSFSELARYSETIITYNRKKEPASHVHIEYDFKALPFSQSEKKSNLCMRDRGCFGSI